MTVVRKAPALTPTGDPRAAFSTVLAKLVYGGESLQAKLTSAQNLAEWREGRMREMNKELERLRITADESPVGKLRISEVLAAITERADELGMWRVRHALDAAKLADFVIAFLAVEDPDDYTARMLDDAITTTMKRADALRTAKKAIA